MTLTPALIAAYKARRAAQNPLNRPGPRNPLAASAYRAALEDVAKGRAPLQARPSYLEHGDVIRFRDKAGRRQTVVWSGGNTIDHGLDSPACLVAQVQLVPNLETR